MEEAPKRGLSLLWQKGVKTSTSHPCNEQKGQDSMASTLSPKLGLSPLVGGKGAQSLGPAAQPIGLGADQTLPGPAGQAGSSRLLQDPPAALQIRSGSQVRGLQLCRFYTLDPADEPRSRPIAEPRS